MTRSRKEGVGERKTPLSPDCDGMCFSSLQGKTTMMTNVARRSCPPVSITWCIFWPCSGRSSSPSCPLQNTGTAGPVSLSPSSWSASWRRSSETWLPTSDAPSAWKILWLQWCSSRLALRYQVENTFRVWFPPDVAAHSPSWPFLSHSFKDCDNKQA